MDNEGQREKAKRLACSCEEGTVGFGICTFLKPAYALVRNTCSGSIGDFYNQNIDMLRAPATPENVARFAEKETQFLATQDFCTKKLGSVLSAEERAQLIMKGQKRCEFLDEWCSSKK